MEATNIKDKISILFSKEEALVLFEWINNFNDRDNNLFEDQSEQRILWDLETVLEKVTGELFNGNYSEHLLKARNKIRDAS